MFEGIILIALGAYIIWSTGKSADDISKLVYNADQLDSLFEKHEQEKRLPDGLLKAIAKVESNFDPYAVNPADPSYGLMQIVYPQKLPAIADWPPSSKEDLFNPDTNLHYAAQILAWNIQRYGILKGIATYNSWSAHSYPDNGPFPNDSYVKKVIASWPLAYETLEPETLYAYGG